MIAFSVVLFCFTAFVLSIPVFDVSKFEARDGGYVFEGDMILSKETIEKALRGENIDAHGYALMNSTRSRWPNGVVPYEIDIRLKDKKDVIEAAMKAWEDKTCIKFVKRTTQSGYLYFFHGGGGGCFSLVGYTGGRQRLSLGDGCTNTVGIPIHEIGHALGLWHEQSRPDRDDYVEIAWENIFKIHQHNFKKYTTGRIDSRNSPYDYDSIMHYGKKAFSKNGKDTIRAKIPGVSFGQRDHVSVQDAWQISKYYDCKN